MIDVSELIGVKCQARRCFSEAAVEVVLLRLDPSQPGGLELRLCVEHREKLAVIGEVARPQVLGVDQEEESG